MNLWEKMNLHQRLESTDPEWTLELEHRLQQVANTQTPTTSPPLGSPKLSPVKRSFQLRLTDLLGLEDPSVPQVHSAPVESVFSRQLPERIFDPLKSSTPLDSFVAGISKKPIDYFSFHPSSLRTLASPDEIQPPVNTPVNTPVDWNPSKTAKTPESHDSFQEKMFSSLDKLSLDKAPSLVTLQGDLDLLSASEATPTRILSVYGIQPWVSNQDLERIFLSHGPLNRLVRSVTDQDLVFLFYLDIRFAMKAKASIEQNLNRLAMLGPISITYASPTPLLQIQLGPVAHTMMHNSGVLSVRGLDDMDMKQVQNYFSRYGDLVGCIQMPHVGLAVEFYDTRDCTKAKEDANGRVIHNHFVEVNYLDVSANMDYVRRRSQFFKDPREPVKPNMVSFPPGYRRFEEHDVYQPLYYPEVKEVKPEPDLPKSLPNNNSMRKHDTLADITPYLQPGLDPTRLRVSKTLESALNSHETPIVPNPDFGSKGCAENPDPTARAIPRGNEVDLWRIGMNLETRTTLMVRNIPNRFTQAMFIEFLNETHRGRFDFVYLRMDYKNRCNVGYAFVNMLEPHDVLTFAQQRVGKLYGYFKSEKLLTISFANVQGKHALIQKFRNSSVMLEDESFRPKLFDKNGNEVAFPSPTTNIRASGSVPTSNSVSPNGFSPFSMSLDATPFFPGL